jgi:hypothetical protein
VTLANSFQIDQGALGNLCSEQELAANRCAGRQQIGRATTTTPLLDQPLSGPVYAVSGSGGLPRLAFILEGQVTIIPRATSSSVKGSRLKTVVPVVPDAPVGHFHLRVFGGKGGYLVNNRDICARRAVSLVSFTGQNGLTKKQRMRVKVPCGKKKSGKKKRSGRASR